MSTNSVSITYCDIEMEIGYETTPYSPAVYYLSNGDPGYPEEGGDFDIFEVIVGGANIISLIKDEDMDEIQQIAIRNLENNY